ncbi:MAG: AMP-binding protein, partial [Sphingobacterium sp.]
MVPTRLFDAITYQFEQFPKKDMLVHKKEGKWTPISSEEVRNRANKIGAGLLAMGMSAGDFTPEGADKIAIISENRPEWIITDLAVQQIGAILVPLYPTTPLEEVAYNLEEAEVKLVFISNQLLLNKYKATLTNIPSIKEIFSFDPTEQPSWEIVAAKANPESRQELERRKAEISADHTATIIYTSGTTGKPKGVMLS